MKFFLLKIFEVLDNCVVFNVFQFVLLSEIKDKDKIRILCKFKVDLSLEKEIEGEICMNRFE